MNKVKAWPHAALIVLGSGVLAGVVAALWTSHETTARAEARPNVARIERINGSVALNRGLDNSASTAQWIQAVPNMPISVGDSIYTRQNSNAEIAFTGRNFAMVEDNTSLDVLEFSNDRTRVAVRGGSALFDIGALSSGELFEVATPCGAVDLEKPGMYEVAIDKQGNAQATVLRGYAEVVGQQGTGRIEQSEVLSVPCQSNASPVVSRVAPDRAGYVVDNYYRHHYPRRYDGRYRNYYTYLDDPYYWDPYNRYTSYQYASDYIPGLYDLDDYGDWQYLSGYGYGWRPYVDTSWAPYQSGYWSMDYPFGLTWVSSEPWGYAPYHYGRWLSSGNQWFWIPDTLNTSPLYSPALVAFLPFAQNLFGWVPLGPGDPYSYTYYDPNWQPVYLTPSVTTLQAVNLGVPGAVTIVPAQDFVGVIDPRVITTLDPPAIARARPVLDPLTVDPLRRAALQTRDAERRTDVPREVAERIKNTPVITSAAPAAPPRSDLARRLRVQVPTEKAMNARMPVKDNRQAPVAQAQALPRQLQQPWLLQARAERRLPPAAQGDRIGQPTNGARVRGEATPLRANASPRANAPPRAVAPPRAIAPPQVAAPPQRSEVRGQRSEVRGQKSEVRGQRSEVGPSRKHVQPRRPR